jgi:predicted RNA-binding protein with EMAP domain
MKHYQIQNEIRRLQKYDGVNKERLLEALHEMLLEPEELTDTEKLKICEDAFRSIVVNHKEETYTYAVFIALETLAKIK